MTAMTAKGALAYFMLGLFMLPVVLAGDLAAAELRLRVTGLRVPGGAVHYALYNRAEDFPDPGRAVKGGEVAVSGASVDVVLRDLAPGTYALAVFHDENENGAFDQGLFGWPLEGFGFSNGAAAWFGPPTFAEAALRIGGPETVAIVSMTYWPSP